MGWLTKPVEDTNKRNKVVEEVVKRGLTSPIKEDNDPKKKKKKGDPKFGLKAWTGKKWYTHHRADWKR